MNYLKPGIISVLLFIIGLFVLEQCFNPGNSNPKEKSIDYYTSKKISYKKVIGDSSEKPTNIINIPLPDGYTRFSSKANSFMDYLQNLPLKKENNTILLYNGEPSSNQSSHFAVLKMNIGNKDLQQCADAIIRLRAEYLFQQMEYSKIHFNFTNGDTAFYVEYAQGYRPSIKENNVNWIKKAGKDFSYGTFIKYLETVFIYAGSYSLEKELLKVSSPAEINIGDIFIQGGFPGHAVIVVDMALDKTSGKKIFF